MILGAKQKQHYMNVTYNLIGLRIKYIRNSLYKAVASIIQ